MVASLTRRWMERLCPGSNGPIRGEGLVLCGMLWGRYATILDGGYIWHRTGA
jgi:hypothetical protein